MRAPAARYRVSRRALAVAVTALLVPSAGGADPVTAGEEAVRVRVVASPASRRTCAAEALRFSLLLCGRPTPTLAEIRERLPLGYEGVSAAEMVALCESLDVPARGVRTTLTDLARSSSPVILHVDGCHFIVFVRLEGDRLVLFDNTIGLFDCSREWFRTRYQWGGDALIIGQRAAPLWFFLSSPWPVLLSAGLFVSVCGLHVLLGGPRRRPNPARPVESPS